MKNTPLSIIAFLILLLSQANEAISQVILPLGGANSRVNAMSFVHLPNGDFMLLCHESYDLDYLYGHPKLIRIDSTGNFISQQSYPQITAWHYPGQMDYDAPFGDLQLTPLGYAFTCKDSSFNTRIIEIDFQGNLTKDLNCNWDQFPLGTDYTFGYQNHPQVLITSKNNYIISSESLYRDSSVWNDAVLFVFEIDGITGDTVWTKRLSDNFGYNSTPNFMDFLITQDSNILICYSPETSFNQHINLLLLDTLGQVIWEKQHQIAANASDMVMGIEQNPNGDFILVTLENAIWHLDNQGDIINNNRYIQGPINSSLLAYAYTAEDYNKFPNQYFFAKQASNYPYIQITDTLGITIKEHVFTNLANYNLQQTIQLSRDKYAFIASAHFGSPYDPPFLNMPYSNSFFYIGDTLDEIKWGSIEGRVFNDLNTSCSWNSYERGLSNYIVECYNINENFSFWTRPDSMGLYQTNLVHGDYELIVHTDSTLWQNCHNSPKLFTLDSIHLRDSIDWGVSAMHSCPHLSTTLTNVLIRRCMTGQVLVNCNNDGTEDALNSYVDVKLDSFLTYTQHTPSSINVDSSLGDNTYRFFLDTFAYGSSISILIDIAVSCDAILGQIHCNESSIFPDTTCIWDRGILAIRDTCHLPDTAIGTIFNAGNDMQQTASYTLVEDSLVIANDTFQLLAGQHINIVYPQPDSHLYWIILHQENGFPPLLGNPIGAYLGANYCNSTPPASHFINSPLINNRILNANDIACNSNIGSFDPNAKIAYPIGSGSNHSIHPNSTINYTIQFQNTGTDTAFLVRIKDTLSPFLDISSLQILGGSHPFTWKIQGENTLLFTFDNIKLVDSLSNEPESHGFVSFKIRPKINTPLLSNIFNQAAIFFDFNEPIITNQVQHQLALDFLLTNVNTIPINSDNDFFSLYPNPSQNEVTVDLKTNYQNSKIYIHNTNGQLMQHFSFDNRRFINLNIHNLPIGIYFLKIETETQNQVLKLIKSE